MKYINSYRFLTNYANVCGVTKVTCTNHHLYGSSTRFRSKSVKFKPVKQIFTNIHAEHELRQVLCTESPCCPRRWPWPGKLISMSMSIFSNLCRSGQTLYLSHSKRSKYDQIDFLRRIYLPKLTSSPRTHISILTPCCVIIFVDIKRMVQRPSIAYFYYTCNISESNAQIIMFKLPVVCIPCWK